MAVDPQQLATEQDQRQAINQMGAPTEFAQGPEQGVRIAGPAAEGMDLGVPGYESINKIAGTKVSWSGAAWVIVDKDNMDQYKYKQLFSQ